ncbi:TldD/PmbA family protein [Candidatus Bathyarchaeota archaeon]|nr:TldD/PmbA family protein [Candidatus Bathyarchaeota archaeon]
MAKHETSEILEFAKKAVNFTIKNGAQEAEAFLSINSGTSINIERGQIDRSIKSSDQGLGVRAIYRNAMGFAYTNKLSDNNIEKIAKRAYKAAKASRSDKNWIKFPNPERFPQIKGTYDKKITELSSENLVQIAADMLGAASNYDKRVFAVNGGVSISIFRNIVVNSHGIEAFDVGTGIGCSLETIARDISDVTPSCFEVDVKRSYDIDSEAVGIEASRKAVLALKAKKIKSEVLPVIFTQAAFRSLLYHTVMNAIKADFVQRERSEYKNKIGEQVASELVTVYDDGLLDGGLLTSKFDDEGVACQKTVIIEKGILKNFLYDNYSANKAGVHSTGNASRSGQAAYSSTPVIGATNFSFKKGNKSTDTLLEEVNNGLVVYGVQGAHSSNPESGEFSVVATPAWKIEKGNIEYSVRDVMLAGVFFDVFKNISALGNNVRQLGHLVAPWIKVENIRIIGK